MNIKLDIDVTPEEMRRLMGLPDLEPFQRQMLEDIRERMTKGVEGYDPMGFFQPYMKSSMAGVELMQRIFTGGLPMGGMDQPKDADQSPGR